MSYGDFPLCLGFGGIPYLLGVLGASAHGVSICLFLYILVAHYVSHFYYGYNYYSSIYGGVFWAVIGFISDHGSFPDGASYKHGVVQPSLLVQRDSEGLIGPASVPQQ